jgi:hypothetical protein
MANPTKFVGGRDSDCVVPSMQKILSVIESGCWKPKRSMWGMAWGYDLWTQMYIRNERTSYGKDIQRMVEPNI